MDWEKAYRDLISNVTIEESSWQFVTSAGAELNASIPETRFGVALTSGALWIRNGKSGPKTRLNYGGPGVSGGFALVPSPLNFSFSIPDMPSEGTVYKLPYAGKSLSLKELKGGFVMRKPAPTRVLVAQKESCSLAVTFSSLVWPAPCS